MISAQVMVVLSSIVVVMVLAVALRRGGWPASVMAARAYLIAVGICWVAPLALMLALHVTLPDSNANGQCKGLGFGCVPPPSDQVVFVWALTLPFTFAAGLVCCAIIAAVHRRRRGDKP